MDGKSKLKLAISITVTVVISIVFAVRVQNYRKQRRKRSKPCYLITETPQKPQYNFKCVLGDNSYSQFKHLKLHDAPTSEEYVNVHPYKEEIGELLKNSNVEFVELFDGKMEMADDEYVWVETESQLQELAEVLSKEKVFAVDTEHHSLRSFLGFIALIQISTKNRDYLVDTTALHDVMKILRPVFSNSQICKVFHGADSDVLWLQRDFHIYVVNLFDTAKACDVLGKQQKSLAYLLETYCGIAKNKQLQLEDWRQRPLPVEMVQYARTDAHYLLYIAQCLALELEQLSRENSSCLDDKFRFVLEASRRSNTSCLQLYTKEIEPYPGESAAASIISRCLNNQGGFQLNCSAAKFQDYVRRLCAWRDIMARVHDESLRYVLSEQAITSLAVKVPTTEMDICETISAADLHSDSMSISAIQSPSLVVCSHLEDINLLFQEHVGGIDDLYFSILQNHLGSDGSCPLSKYNYVLLSKSSLEVGKRLVSIPKKNGLGLAKQVARKASRDLFVQKFSCKSPVYHNCRIFANDGRLLCYCDRKKIDWYLSRDLAKLIEDDPPAIMLRFEPKGRPEDEGNDFYIQSKKNICVGCGQGDHYLRYRIIPSCYRMHFPEHLKSHRSHDIVLLCVDCHEIAHVAAEKHKRQLAAEYGIPLYIRNVMASNQAQNATESSADVNFEGVSPLQLRIAAMALLRHGHKMPSNRREELTQIIVKYYGGRQITEEDLERALLVGMSPHERRRHEKKGLALRNSRCTNIGESFQMESADSSIQIDTEAGLLCSNSGANGELSSANGKEIDSDIGQILKANCTPISDSDGLSESNNPSNGTANALHSNGDGSVSSKHDTKYSLLGHGPHGKQVVDYLLKQYGEDGIRQFCQRWRQVFVEALHPRFLPAGWDVMHSGRRDFGDFSVYHPSKREPAAAPSADSGPREIGQI